MSPWLLVMQEGGIATSEVPQGGRGRRISVRLLSGESAHLREGVDLTVEVSNSFKVHPLYIEGPYHLVTCLLQA